MIRTTTAREELTIPIYPDAELDNADWTKQTWDLSTDPDFWANADLQLLRKLITLPAYRAAPAAIRTIVDDRIAGAK